MFGHPPFYFGLTRKYVAYFGTIFNDVYISRSVKGSDPSQLIKVPLAYAAKKRIVERFDQDPEIARQFAISLPRMSFEMAGTFQYDGNRNLPGLNQFVYKNATDPNKVKTVFTPHPVNIPFNLNIYVKNTEDGTKIFEQIIPFFKPEWTASLQLIPEMGITLDVPVEYNGMEIEDKYDGSFKERQILTQTLKFTMRAYLFSPIYNKPIIKYSYTNFYFEQGGDKMGQILHTPGLDANGDPTSNSLLSIPIADIEIDDDFGYVTDVSGAIITQTEE